MEGARGRGRGSERVSRGEDGHAPARGVQAEARVRAGRAHEIRGPGIGIRFARVHKDVSLLLAVALLAEAAILAAVLHLARLTLPPVVDRAAARSFGVAGGALARTWTLTAMLTSSSRRDENRRALRASSVLRRWFEPSPRAHFVPRATRTHVCDARDGMSRHPGDARRVGAPTSPQRVGVRGADLRDRPPLEGATLAHRPRVQPHAEEARRRLPPRGVRHQPDRRSRSREPVGARGARREPRPRRSPRRASPNPPPGVWAPAPAVAPSSD